MSTTSLSLAVWTVRWWVRLYTAGVGAAWQDPRRAEIESDLWEQGWDARQAGVRPIETALQILGRLVLSIPTDVVWRLSKGGAERRVAVAGAGMARKAGNVIAFVTYRSYIGFAAALLTLILVIGVAAWLSLTDQPTAPEVLHDAPIAPSREAPDHPEGAPPERGYLVFRATPSGRAIPSGDMFLGVRSQRIGMFIYLPSSNFGGCVFDLPADSSDATIINTPDGLWIERIPVEPHAFAIYGTYTGGGERKRCGVRFEPRMSATEVGIHTGTGSLPEPPSP